MHWIRGRSEPPSRLGGNTGCRQGRRQECRQGRRQGHGSLQTAVATFSSICSYSCSCRHALAWDQAVIMALTHLSWCLHSVVCGS